MRPANEKLRYNVTSSLIGWAHTQNDPCFYHYRTVCNIVQPWIAITLHGAITVLCAMVVQVIHDKPLTAVELSKSPGAVDITMTSYGRHVP